MLLNLWWHKPLATAAPGQKHTPGRYGRSQHRQEGRGLCEQLPARLSGGLLDTFLGMCQNGSVHATPEALRMQRPRTDEGGLF